MTGWQMKRIELVKRPICSWGELDRTLICVDKYWHANCAGGRYLKCRGIEFTAKGIGLLMDTSENNSVVVGDWV